MSPTRKAGPSGRTELQDLTECPICCLRFDRPLQLTCGHSFCGNCVDRLIADVRNVEQRNDNFMEGFRRIALPNLDRGVDPLNFIHNRMDNELWLPPRPPPPLPYPGLGGVPRHGVFRNYLYDEGPPFHNRGGHNGELIIKCPECRQPTKVPPEGLSVNYRLQELVARVSEANTSTSTENSDTDGSRLPKCLACSEVISKGVYLSCSTCAAEGEAVRQLCSMCCLRNHNGHVIEEKRFLTMSDIVVGRESVSEAAGRGYQAVDQVLQEFDACAASSKDFFHETARNVLRAFEIIASNMQFEVLSCHDELERKVNMAQEISAKLEQLPIIVKGLLDEYRKNLDAAMVHFVSSTLIYEGLHESSPSPEIPNRDPEMDGESSGTSNHNGTDAASERRSGCRPSLCDGVRDGPKAFPLLDRRKTRQLRMMQQQCSALRRQRLQERLNRDAYSAQLYNLGAERQRQERLRDELRSDLFDTEDRSSHDSSCRRHRTTHSHRANPATGSSSSGLASNRVQKGEERGRSNSVEIISSSPPTVADLEQRAGRLIITPERRVPKTEAGAEDGHGDEILFVTGKRRRGVEKAGHGTDPADFAEAVVAPESRTPRLRPTKRKIGVYGMNFTPSPSNEPGPSFLEEVSGDAVAGESVDSSHGEGGTSSDANFENVDFLE